GPGVVGPELDGVLVHELKEVLIAGHDELGPARGLVPVGGHHVVGLVAGDGHLLDAARLQERLGHPEGRLLALLVLGRGVLGAGGLVAVVEGLAPHRGTGVPADHHGTGLVRPREPPQRADEGGQRAGLPALAVAQAGVLHRLDATDEEVVAVHEHHRADHQPSSSSWHTGLRIVVTTRWTTMPPSSPRPATNRPTSSWNSARVPACGSAMSKLTTRWRRPYRPTSPHRRRGSGGGLAYTTSLIRVRISSNPSSPTARGIGT